MSTITTVMNEIQEVMNLVDENEIDNVVKKLTKIREYSLLVLEEVVSKVKDLR